MVGHVLSTFDVSEAVFDPCQAPRFVAIVESQADQGYSQWKS
jgi:hypothetical protein